jgi:osmoprotectant transport system ATP-binding protein
MITFGAVSKQFPDGTVAVDNLDLEIETGELTVLVGPSGCGKTTTLRMINRLDEASRGTIEIDGQDIRSVDRTELRRGIGYVMQHSGLFPHRKIRDNIATVPHLLKWDKRKTYKRVDELIELVGLDAELADRYPHQLSGGQQQRVGVARALAADPPIMLMDEPFAAVDPIVRAHLQDEFLRLQQRLQKTIVFVTHDIDEAIKLGDRIAIFQRGGRLAQYARPADLLGAPANGFVVDFLGAERELKRLALIKAASIECQRGPVVAPDDTPASALATAERHAAPWVIVVSADGQLNGWLQVAVLRNGCTRVGDCGYQPFAQTLSGRDSLRAALNAIVTSPLGVVPVLDAQGAYAGLLDHASLNRQLS